MRALYSARPIAQRCVQCHINLMNSVISLLCIYIFGCNIEIDNDVYRLGDNIGGQSAAAISDGKAVHIGRLHDDGLDGLPLLARL